jgi:hypothetical protein
MTAMLATIPMMATTRSSSISEKPSSLRVIAAIPSLRHGNEQKRNAEQPRKLELTLCPVQVVVPRPGRGVRRPVT